MHQDLLQLQTCQFKPAKPFQWAKQNPRSWYSEITPINTLRHVGWKLPISRKHFWAITLFGQKWPKQSWTKKLTFQNNPHTEKRCFNLEDHLWHVSLPGVEKLQKKWKKRKKRKRKLIVMSCTWKNSISPKQQSRKKTLQFR